MIPLRDISLFSSGDRLFYELGFKIDSRKGYGENWVSTGKFKEIDNPKEFLADDMFIFNMEYLEHHNFMFIKK